MLDLAGVIEQNRRRSSAPLRILRLSHGQRRREEEMRACDVIYGQALNIELAALRVFNI